MDVTSSVMMAEYYEKLIDLQDKLRRSEEERLKLEIKFSEIIQVTREEEQLHYRKLRHQYKIFLEEDRRRQERNEKIVKSLEKIDARISRLTSKTELYQRPRRFCRNCHHRSCPITKSPCVNDTQKSEPTFPKYEQDYQKESTDKLDVIDGYSSSLMKPNKYERINTNDLDRLREGLNKRFDSNKANLIATEIMNSIYSRHYERDNSDAKKLDISQPIPKLFEPFNEETETSQLNIQNASASYNKSNVRNIPGNEQSEKSAKKFHDSENKPALSSKQHGEENSFHLEAESKIVQELNCPTKENYMTDRDITDIKDPRKNLTGQQFLKKMPDTERSNVPIASKESSLDVRSTVANLSKREESQISPPKIEREGGYEKVQGAPSTQINGGNRSEQSEEPRQQIREDFQTKRSNESLPVEDVDHPELEYDQRCEKKPTNQYETSKPIDQYAPPCDENGQAIQQQQVDTNSQQTPYNQNEQVIQQQLLNGNGKHIDQFEHQQKEFNEDNGQHVEQLLQQQQQFDENGQHIDQYQARNDENGQDSQQQPFDENGQHLDQYQPRYDENGQFLQQYDDNGQAIQYDENGQVIQYDENGQAIQYDQSGQAIQYDESGPAIQYNKNGQAIHYDENGQAIQYDQSGQAVQYDENGQAIQYDENGQAVQYDENGQAIQYDQNGQASQYDENGPAIQYNKNGQAIQYDENGQAIQYDENGQAVQYDENGHSVQYDENGQAVQYDENGQAIQYDQNGQAIHYDENGQASQYDESGSAIQYNKNGQAIHYDENGQAIQYDENGQAVQYDENGQAIQYDQNGQASQYDENGPANQYNKNGQAIHYDENGQAIQYDENGQAIQYDENGQAVQYDENGQAVQYDENGQAVQYDENGQAIQYDQNGQAIHYNENGQAIQFDEHGQPYAAYEGDPNLHYGQYNEEGEAIQQPFHENQQPIQENGNYVQSDFKAGDGNEENTQGNEQMHSDGRADLNPDGKGETNILEQAETSGISIDPEAGGKVDGDHNKFLDMLDTDTDSVMQNTSKISNDSDFDFGSG